MFKLALVLSFIFTNLSSAKTEVLNNQVDCQFLSSSDSLPVPLIIQSDFEAFQTEIQSCVYIKAEAPGVDEVGLCLKLSRDGIDQGQASKLQIDLMSGIMGIYRTQNTQEIDLKVTKLEFITLSAEFQNGLTTEAQCKLNSIE